MHRHINISMPQVLKWIIHGNGERHISINTCYLHLQFYFSFSNDSIFELFTVKRNGQYQNV